MLIVVSKAKAYAKDKHDMRLGSDFLEKLSATVARLIDEAVAEAKNSEMGTVKARHLPRQ